MGSGGKPGKLAHNANGMAWRGSLQCKCSTYPLDRLLAGHMHGYGQHVELMAEMSVAPDPLARLSDKVMKH